MKGGTTNIMGTNFYGTLFDMEEITPPLFPDNFFYAVDFQESNINREADYTIIQRAVKKCYESGGGTVIVSSGTWVSGPIHLKSNVHLKIEKDAVIKFSDKFSDYLPVVFTRWEGMECYNYSPLIYAKDCENIAITGEGTLIGNGEAWWHWKRIQQPAATKLCYAQSLDIPVQDRIFGTEEDALRPSFIQPINCKNVLIQGITVKDGPQWMIHPVYCENVLIRKVDVVSNGHNTDGLNPDSCKNVLIESCFFATGDDCIAINSGMNEDGWRVNKPCENIVIRDCVMKEGHGGVVIGSGMSGGVKNVYANNCKISGTNQGIRLKSMRGRGGFVENIWFENIDINDVGEEAVQVNMFYQFTTVVPKSDTPPTFKNINIKNVFGKGAKTAIEIRGLPECSLDEISLNNIHLSAETAMVCSDVEKINIQGIELHADINKSIDFSNVKHIVMKYFCVK